MNINSSLSLSNSESSKKGAIMPSLISSNCEMSSKCMDESLEEGSRLQQHYCITLGVGPLWWSWCAPCRIVCIHSQHREPRRGDQAESALCELPHCARGWIVESCEKQRTIASNVHPPLDREYVRRVGDRSVAALSIHSRTELPSARRIKRGLCLPSGIRRGNIALHQYHRLPA